MEAMYRDFCLMPFAVRRYDRAVNPPYADVDVIGHYRQYGSKEITGSIAQGDYAVIVVVADLVAQNFVMPVLKQDKVMLGGREYAIVSPGERKALDGTLIAYELQVRG